MPRPPGVQVEHCVDAIKCVHAELELTREFTLDALPRLQEAGAKARTRLELQLQFRRVVQKIAIEGTLQGQLELVCQRCMGPVLMPLQEPFKVVIVADEAATSEQFDDYEPILVDPIRLDLQWLAEEQALLALPLVARHAPGVCDTGVPPRDEASTQRPFGKLRDMMRGR